MKYNNLFDATDTLGKYLYSFAGHRVDTTHTSHMFSLMAGTIARMSKNKAIVSENYEATIYTKGESIPVCVTFSGHDIFKPVDVVVSRNFPD